MAEMWTDTVEWIFAASGHAMQVHVVRRSTVRRTMYETTRAQQEIVCQRCVLPLLFASIVTMNTEKTDICWNEMAAMLSPIKHKSSLTPEVVARIEANKKAAEVRRMHVSSRTVSSEVMARIEANKQAAEARKMARELGYSKMVPPVCISHIAPAESAEDELKHEMLKAERKRQERIAIVQKQHAENAAKKRREERLLFLQKQAANTHEVFDEIDKEIDFLESFMKNRY